ncbi:carbohydrate ABC transporter permease [Devosia sp. ZB163]|uniref:carbohydrate ABC transporter permease n=1 Tax=Devosia sp. ZB163 TaxID=3025938 RepID=UPI00235F35F2|nr:carbohydrate ABC transporter permease [Devosia sp. ZB163]MDC9822209.1 carbohydrate ABC transporter permease [Devosia sp. ZB163]
MIAGKQEPLLGRTPYYVLTGGLAIIFLFPLVWSFYASVSPQAGTAQSKGFGWGNYQTMFDFGAGLPTVAANSAVISILTVAITLAVSTLGGYAFARFKFWGKDALFLLTLSILMVPYATLLIPLYVLLNAVGLSNSLVGVALMIAMFQLPFATYMMRISFEAIPRELEESAQIDGCNSFGVLWRIMLPSVTPGLVTVGLFAFLAAWNDFFAPLILLTDPTKQPLPVTVANLRQQTMGVINYGATEAGVVVMALPCIILFLLLQRYYVRGFMSGAVKG